MRLPDKPRSCSTMSSREPSGASARSSVSSIDALTKNNVSANVGHACSSIGRRENFSMPSFANARYLSSSNSFRPTPTMDVRGGSNPSRWRLYSAGSSLRCARSPAPPKMTTVTGAAATGGVSATARRSNSDGVSAIVLLHAMAAELVAERGKQPFGERVRIARPESREDRCGQHGHRDGTLERLDQRPTPFARIFDIRFEIRELGVFRERTGGKLQQPRSDDAAVIPEIGDRGRVDAVRARVQQLEPLGVCLHQPVLNSVVDHLDVVAGAVIPGAQVSAFGRKREKDWFQPFADVDLSADHQAVAFVQTPDAAARAGIDVVNLLQRQRSSPPDVVVEIRVAAVDDGVADRYQLSERVYGR